MLPRRAEWTWDQWQWKGDLHSPKPQHHWNLTIRLFSVISGHSWVVFSFFTSLQRCNRCILHPQTTGKVKHWTLLEIYKNPHIYYQIESFPTHFISIISFILIYITIWNIYGRSGSNHWRFDLSVLMFNKKSWKAKWSYDINHSNFVTLACWTKCTEQNITLFKGRIVQVQQRVKACWKDRSINVLIYWSRDLALICSSFSKAYFGLIDNR